MNNGSQSTPNWFLDRESGRPLTTSTSQWHLLVVTVVWIGSGIYLSTFVERGWIPNDEGSLAHSAERVLRGELPHHDFDELYTGGLTYLHASAFWLLGVKLNSIRWTVFVFALAFVPAVYYIAARTATAWIAGLITLLCVILSIPNYFCGMPSWYILFFSTFCTAALFRHIDTGRRRWLLVAGLCGGLALLIKVTALYFVAAALLFLLYREQVESHAHSNTRGKRSPVVLAITCLITLTFCCLLYFLVRPNLGLMEGLTFVAPGIALCGILVQNEWCEGTGTLAQRLPAFAGKASCFVCGLLLPLVCFVAWFSMQGALTDFYYCVFVQPLKRLQVSTFPLPPIDALLTTLPLLAVFVFGFYTPKRWDGYSAPVVATGLLAVLTLIETYPELQHGQFDTLVYRRVWHSMSCVLPVVALVATWSLVRHRNVAPETRQRLFLMTAMAALLSLTQFPYAFAIYYCYSAPLVILAIQFIVASQASAPLRVWLCVLAFYLVFGVGWLNTGFIRTFGSLYIPTSYNYRMDLPRGGLFVEQRDKQLYETLVNIIAEHSDAGSYIYAAPDCPEVYFLAGRRNPTRTFTIQILFDDPAERKAEILRRLEEKGVRLIVINQQPEFSKPVDSDLMSEIGARFPDGVLVGHFYVAWNAER